MLIQTQFLNFTLSRLKFNTKCITILRPCKQWTKPEKQTLLIDTWTTFVSNTYSNAKSQELLKMLWDYSWEMMPTLMSCKITGTLLRQESHSWREINLMLVSDILLWSLSNLVICNQMNLISTTIVSENGLLENIQNLSHTMIIFSLIKNLLKLPTMPSNIWENMNHSSKLTKRERNRSKRLNNWLRKKRTKRRKTNKQKQRSWILLKLSERNLTTMERSSDRLLLLTQWKKHLNGQRMSSLLNSLTKIILRKIIFILRLIMKQFLFLFILTSLFLSWRVSKSFWMPKTMKLISNWWLCEFWPTVIFYFYLVETCLAKNETHEITK